MKMEMYSIESPFIVLGLIDTGLDVCCLLTTVDVCVCFLFAICVLLESQK